MVFIVAKGSGMLVLAAEPVWLAARLELGNASGDTPDDAARVALDDCTAEVFATANVSRNLDLRRRRRSAR
jgi:hypothetical protein